MPEKLEMMIWFLFLLLKEELSNIWTSFLKNIEKICLKTKENIFNAQELLDIQRGKLSPSQTKDSATNQIPLQEPKSFKSMTITENTLKTISKQ